MTESFQGGFQNLRSLEKPLKVGCWIRSSLDIIISIDHDNNALIRQVLTDVIMIFVQF